MTAEYTRIVVGPTSFTVSGTLSGAASLAAGEGHAWLLARNRRDRRALRQPATVSADSFRSVVDLAQFVSGSPDPQAWDLYLLIADGPRVRIAAPLPNVPNRAKVLRYPPRFLPVPDPQASGMLRRVAPYVTQNGWLSVASHPLPAVEPAAVETRRQGLPQGLRSTLAQATQRVSRRVSKQFSRRAGRLTQVVATKPLRMLLVQRRRTSVDPPAGAPPGRISFLILHAYGMGGTIRTTLNVAEHLARDYEVEIVSVLRRRGEPFFPFPAGVTVRSLDDSTRPDPRGGAWLPALERLLGRMPSALIHIEDFGWRACSLRTDLALLRWLWSMPQSVLVTTRPALNLIAAEYAPPGVVTVGQEHQHVNAHRQALAATMARQYRKLDALAVLSESDERDYRRILQGRTLVARIPNALPTLPAVAAVPRRKVVIAAGRLTWQKGFDLLIEAFADVAGLEPEWTLQIFGSGPKQRELRELINRLELYNSVFLMGSTDRLAEEMATASLFALSSRYEGFGMVIIEAMSQGLPVVSFDCPNGPAEILDDGVDGRLVADGDVAAFRATLLELIRDSDQRNRLATTALDTVRRYSPGVISLQWRDLLTTLHASSAG